MRTGPGVARTGREEGLDERGEAPPPYLPKEPQGVHLAGGVGERNGGFPPHGDGIPLQDMGRGDQKPPDYEPGPSSPVGRRPGDEGDMIR